MVTADPAVVARAERLVLPGVGAFDHGMRNLAERGLVEVLNQKALRDRTPVLGVCLGMQLLTGCSEEGTLRGLGWIEGETVRFDRSGTRAARDAHGVEHVDWHAPHPLFAELPAVPRFYFVHAFHVVCRHQRNVLARSTYGYPFASAIVEGNVVGMQFHPEKSHRFGMAVPRLRRDARGRGGGAGGERERRGMIQTRVIPCLLLRGAGWSRRCASGAALRRRSDQHRPHLQRQGGGRARAARHRPRPRGARARLDAIAAVAGECFMPLCYGGGVRTWTTCTRILERRRREGALNTRAVEDPAIVTAAAERFGSQSVVVSIDVRRALRRRQRGGHARGAAQDGARSRRARARRWSAAGAGEILLTSVDRDGHAGGATTSTSIRRVATAAVDVPVIACGGAANVEDLRRAVREGGAAAVAAGSMFVYHGPAPRGARHLPGAARAGGAVRGRPRRVTARRPPRRPAAALTHTQDRIGMSSREWFAHETAVDQGAEIGAGTKIRHFSHVSAGSKRGERRSPGQNVFAAPRVTVGSGVKIQNNLSRYEGVVLEGHVFRGPGMVFTRVRTPRVAFRATPRRTTRPRACATAPASAPTPPRSAARRRVPGRSSRPARW